MSRGEEVGQGAASMFAKLVGIKVVAGAVHNNIVYWGSGDMGINQGLTLWRRSFEFSGPIPKGGCGWTV